MLVNTPPLPIGKPVWRARLSLLGLPTAFIADHPDLLATACEAYAAWSVEDAVPGRPRELRLDLGDTSTLAVSAGVRVEGSRLTLGDCGFADAVAQRAWCRVPPALIGDPRALAEITDTLLLFLIARAGRTPVHAAGVTIGGTALVLAGPSGTGKSTLALAATTQGLGVLSDDTVYVQHAPHFRLWGTPGPIHVFAHDAPPGDHATRLRAGKRKAAVAVPRALPAPAARAALVVLRRGGGPALTPIAPEDAVAACLPLEAGFDLLPIESLAALRTLAAQGAWHLSLSDDPAAAIALLRARFETARP